MELGFEVAFLDVVYLHNACAMHIMNSLPFLHGSCTSESLGLQHVMEGISFRNSTVLQYFFSSSGSSS